MNFIRYKVFYGMKFEVFSLILASFCFPEKDLCSLRCQPAVFFSGSAALSALEVCTLMGFIDLNNIRGCGDVIKAEITSV